MDADPDLAGLSTDRALVDRLLSGDVSAGETLVERNYTMVFRTLMKLSGDQDLAADLTQETFRKAWSSLRTFRGEARFSSWLYRVAYTTFLNHIRKPHLVQPMSDFDVELDPESEQERADERLPRRESEDQLRLAVVNLPDQQRLAITAKFWGGLSTAEIAALQHVTPTAVRKRLRKALRRLAVALESETQTLNALSSRGGTNS